MRRLVGFLFVIAMVSAALPAFADNDSGTFFVPLASKTKVVYVVRTAPAFDGTGAASREHILYAPYDGTPSWGPRVHHSDYYEAVWQAQ